MNPPVPTSALTAAGLLGGFAAARYTHRREVGGLVWAAAGAASAASWRRHGPAVTGGLLGLYAAAMGSSHPLAKKLGPWPSVLAVTAATSAAAWVLADRHG
jgi:hypothetical protein